MNTEEILKFLYGYIRMCANTPCEKCKIYKFLDDHKLEACVLDDIILEDPAAFVNIVSEWMEEHPYITNAAKFKEVFGDAPTLYQDDMGIIMIEEPVPYWWNKEYKTPNS